MFTLLFSVLNLIVFSQQIESFETILNDKISIRAIELFDGKVWYSGTDSKFGYVDLKNPQNQKQIKLSEKKLQFRTLAQNKDAFYAINIESPAHFFRIDKKDLSVVNIYTDTLKTAFYDAFIFVNDEHAVTFSDPAKDLNLKLSFIMPKLNSVLDFNTLTKREGFNSIKLNEGEAAFAASNTNIVHYGTNIWIATGGKNSRIIKIDYTTLKSYIYKTPFIQGESSQGMYSIDFSDDKFGIAVGGDYTKQEANINNIATTNDGGETWQIQASGKNAGYMTCVKIKPGSKGKEIIAIGDKHISYSSDFGKTWKKIADEKGFYVCKWVDKNTVVLAGKDKISVMKLKF
ncbi:WD40/YVTN/BNR-like repeat-containing protein [Chryseobacterium sp. CBo1]|uniref:WD40/YVTN/BNR-like repeat-containing protein n=1 Tax=Chryseobacterium sp. CBo1 TaxID=1869230 RepID=UPI001E55F473|nr:glycosyl hydrolase [Chryseobacterium sp. CBo1]